MALPRLEQKISEYYPTLGVAYVHHIAYLIRLCKGQILDKSSRWFYYQFLSRGSHAAPKDVISVRDKLVSAYWVEEDDLIQEIIILIHSLQVTEKSNILKILGRNLRDYLVNDQRVFARQNGWEERYSVGHVEFVEPEEVAIQSYGLHLVFDNSLPLPLFEKYLTYLQCILKLSINDMAKVLLKCPRQVKFFKAKMIKELENAHT